MADERDREHGLSRKGWWVGVSLAVILMFFRSVSYFFLVVSLHQSVKRSLFTSLSWKRS